MEKQDMNLIDAPLAAAAAPPSVDALLDALPGPTVLARPDGTVARLNPAAARALGVDESSQLDGPFWELACDAVDRDRLRAAFAARSAGVEVDLPGGRGTLAWSFRDVGGTGTGGGHVVCAATDVSERRRLDGELAAAREKLRALVEHSPDYVSFHDADMRYTWVSRVNQPWTPDMMVGLRDADFIPPEDVGWLEDMRRRVMATGVPERNEMGFDVEGTYRRFESVIQRRTDAAGKLLGTAAYTRDITDRWNVEQELRRMNETLEARIAERTAAAERHAEELRLSEQRMRRSEERFRRLFEQSPMSMQVIARDGKIQRTNRAWEVLWGVTLDQIPDANLLADPQLEANGVRPLLLRAFAGETIRLEPVPFVPDRGAFAGSTRWVRAVIYPATIAEAPADEIVIVQEDVTEQIGAQEKLRLRNALLEAVGEAAIDGVLAVSAAGEILWSNHRFARMWGIPEAVLASGSDAAALDAVRSHLADPDRFFRRVAHLYENPDERGSDEVRLKDGRVFDRYTAPVVTGPEAREGRVWFFHDVTERHRAAERNEWLTREVEHRVGNHLAGLVGLVSVMRGRIKDVGTFADAIEARLRGMAEVHRLLTSAGLEPVGMRAVVSTALEATRCMTAHEAAETVAGPDVQVSAKRAIPLMMVLVEWYTNSCKYGAHTVPGGTLRVTWGTVADGKRVRLRWRERGVPIPRGPVRRSIGMGLVAELTARELGGEGRMNLRPDGADHWLEFPVE